MKYNQIGQSDIQVSEIGFGCMSLGIDERNNKFIIDQALEYGINFFDTADLYEKGLNEEQVGKILKDKRSDCILATKVGNQWRADGSGWDWNPRKEYIMKAVESSLKRLGTDYIDLYQLHGGTLEDPIDEVIEAFSTLTDQGKIRQYGISSIRPEVIKKYVERSAIVSVMMQFSLLDRRPEESMMKLLEENEIPILARGGIAQGLLVNKPAKEYLNYTVKDVEVAAKAVNFVAGTKRSPSQTALLYVLKKPPVASAIVGIRTIEQLNDVAKIASAPELTAAEYAFLSESVKPKLYEKFR
ncbi:putative oxidoreductase [Arcticibacter svalbardensis MN12-7]|uniref:Putative oxidoreductase n=1 Tax=Arcticibacter svalbardensis MN12-7 TaxID=1150600 RepID=R9GVZ0_9SPHI|nr:aldo/keto reductase [Arcticibacter svalbardensis]EOR95665.1 putative oxidoreductase [Arcticibacter svalbardensis MN12-7]